jgi:hypothetical protein
MPTASLSRAGRDRRTHVGGYLFAILIGLATLGCIGAMVWAMRY